MNDPYNNLCFLLHEFKEARDSLDDDGAVRLAMSIRFVATQLYIETANAASAYIDPKQLSFDFDGLH